MSILFKQVCKDILYYIQPTVSSSLSILCQLMYARQDGFYNICITGRDTTSVKTSTIVLSGVSSFLCNVLLSYPNNNQLIFPTSTLMTLGISLTFLSQQSNIHYAQGNNSNSLIIGLHIIKFGKYRCLISAVCCK